METRSNFLTGSFTDLKSAERAYEKLREKGYSDDDISIIMSEESLKKYFKDDKGRSKSDDKSEFGNKAMEGAGTGSAIGGTVGAAAGIIAAIGTSVVIPGLGFVIAGPIAAGLAGAGAGGLTGGIIGALVGAGMPKERAEQYEQGIKEGNIVIGVQLRDDADAHSLEEDWGNYGHNIYR
ncbi:MAG: hypothetical protein R6W68_12030 [Ignavibacteriaceae bacterium]